MKKAFKKPLILIIEDEEYNRRLYEQILAEIDCDIRLAENPGKGLQVCSQFEPDLVLLDLKYDRDSSREGLECLKQIRKENPDIEVIVISGSQRDSTKIEAMLQYGAYDYLVKPIRRDVLLMVVNRVLERIRLKRENYLLRKDLHKIRKFEGFQGLIGESSAMKNVYDKIEKIAGFDSTILITGETGTGKELVARAIHKLSGRSPFVAIDLGSIANDLMSSELFGHQRGSFTGALTDRKGKIEAAGSGSVFLDEIENVSPDAQQQLLRLLEDRSYCRIGSNSPMRTEARFIIATNVDLQDFVARKKFRQDLYHRLNVINIRMPALKERLEDMELLAQHFLHIHSMSLDIHKSLATGAVQKLKEHSWPGNVRELKNTIEEALIFGVDENFILPQDFNFDSSGKHADAELLKIQTIHTIKTLKQGETEGKVQVIVNALREAKGCISDAARLLDITPRHLHRLLDEYSIQTDNYV